MTDDEIKRLRALCEAATPGPWEKIWPAFRDQNYRDILVSLRSVIHRDLTAGDRLEWSRTLDSAVSSMEAGYGVQGPDDGSESVPVSYEEDADFIAAARTALPALLDEVERLTKENAGAFDIVHERDEARRIARELHARLREVDVSRVVGDLPAWPVNP